MARLTAQLPVSGSSWDKAYGGNPQHFSALLVLTGVRLCRVSRGLGKSKAKMPLCHHALLAAPTPQLVKGRPPEAMDFQSPDLHTLTPEHFGQRIPLGIAQQVRGLLSSARQELQEE